MNQPLLKPYIQSKKPCRQQTAGFSLIEILVVLFIIGLAVNMITYQFDFDDENLLQKQALQVHTSINMLSEFGVLNNVETGFHIDKETIEFLSFDGQKWNVFSGLDVIKPITIDEKIEIEFILDDLPGSELNLLEQIDWRTLMGSDDEENFLELDKLTVPQVILLSSGEVSPFSLSLSLKDSPENNYRIQGEFMAPVLLKQGDEQ